MPGTVANHFHHANETKFSDRKKRIFTFLRQNPIGILSTVTSDGSPHGVVVYFLINEDFSVSFLTKIETRKYNNLIHDKRAMLTVYEPGTQATVQITGTAHKIKDEHVINEIASTILYISLKSSEAGTPPLSKLDAGIYVAIKLTHTQARMAVYARPDRGGYDELFESVESFDLSSDD